MLIAICDDDKDELLRISSILDEYREERKAPILYKTFNNATDLLAVAQGSGFSLYLLDVMMPGVSGIEAARELRTFDNNAELVFLTSSPEFAFQSYSVKARDYLLKPAKAQQLFAIMDEMFAQRQKPQEAINIKTKAGLVRILFSSLAYLEVINKHLYFHLSDGKTHETIATLAEFERELLSRPEFVQTHRSCIVNLWQVERLSPNGIVMLMGDNVPVSRMFYAKVKEAYFEQSFCKEAE